MSYCYKFVPIVFIINSVHYTEPPNITAMEYTNLMDSTDNADSAVANITCITENSPPTNVTWIMDGSVLDIDGQNYSILQTVTNRTSSKYRTTLLIKTLFSIIGTHNFTCLITNIAGSDAESMITYLPGIYACIIRHSCIKCVTKTYFKSFTAIPVVNTFTDTLPIHSKAVTIECVSFIETEVAFSDDILPHLHLEWVGSNGVQLASDSTITVGKQRIENCTVVRNLTFNSLNLSHSGQYMCRASLNTGSEVFTTETNHTLVISSKL